jgi:autotransporter-associated beta strand protein
LVRAGIGCVVLGAMLSGDVGLRAQIFNMVDTTGNGFGTSGFTGTTWTPTTDGTNSTAPPTSGAPFSETFNYIVAPLDIRTPNTGTAAMPTTFAGDSLTITDNARLLWKGGTGEVVTINNLNLDGANIRNAQGLNWTLAGNSIRIGPNGAIVWNSSGGGNNTISGNISGTGVLALGGIDVTTAIAYTSILSGSNTLTGPLNLLGGTTQLGSNAATAANNAPNALPANAILQFGSQTPNTANGNATLNLNGGTYTIAGLSTSSYTSVTATGTAFNTGNSGARITVSFPTLPPGIQVGQLVTRGGSVAYVTTIDYATNTIGLGDASGITSSGTFTFSGSGPLNDTTRNQAITNTNTANPATLIFAGGQTASVFDGQINQGAGASTRLTVASGSLTLRRGGSYTGNTTLSGGTLVLDFNTNTSAANNIVNAASPLNLAGGTLSLNSTTSTTTTANAQAFGGTTISGSSAVQLTANFQGGNPINPRDSIALNLGAITRTTGTVDVTNPAGTLSTTNGVRTSSGSANALLTDASGAAYVTVAGTDWGVKDATNAFIVALPSYTNSTATTLAGNADVVTNVALSGSTTVSTMRFNSGSSLTVSGGTLSTGGILMTGNAGASAINGGTLEGTSGGNLTLIQYNTANNLSIGSVISDNGSATALDKTGAGTVVVSGANNYTGATTVGGGTLEFAKQNSLPSLGANGLTVNNGATLAVNVGGAGEFTTTDVGNLALLAGFQSGSLLGIDTTNAGGPVTLSAGIANPNSGANAIGISKMGGGTLVLGAANTYTGTTSVRGGTLQLGVANAISTSSPVSISGGILDLNNTATTLQSVTGSGGTLAMGSGNLTIGGGVSTTYSGSVTGSGGVIIRNGSKQIFAGTPSYTGPTTVVNGSLTLSSSSSSSVGSGASDVSIGAVDSTNPATEPLNTASGNLAVGSGVTLTANNIFVGTVDSLGTNGGVGRLTQTGGQITANALYLGGKGGAYTQGGASATFPVPVRGTLQLNGGTLTVPAVSTAGGANATVNFSGGTLQAPSGGSDPTNFIDQTNIPNVIVQSGGANIDTNGHTFAMTNNFVHDPFGPAVDGGFNKKGTGTLTLSGTNTFTGFTAATGGTLVVSTANAATAGFAANGASAIVDVSALTAPLSVTSAQAIQGVGTILGAAAGFSHTAGTISGGVSTTAGSTGALTFSGGNLDLNGGTVRFDLNADPSASTNPTTNLGGNDKILSSVGLTASGPSNIDLEFASKANDSLVHTYTLFDYAGPQLASTNNLVIVGNGGRGIAPTAANPTLGLHLVAGGALGQTVQLNFKNIQSGTLTWNSSSDPNWDTNTAHTNWLNTTPNTLHDSFFNGDSVAFDDTGTVLGITIGSQVVPSSITVGKSSPLSTKSYTFSGSGKIGGSTSLVSNGSGTLTIATNNDYQGGTTINDNGTILLTNSVGAGNYGGGSTSGTGTGNVTVGASATLQIGNGTSGLGSVLGAIHDNGSVIINRPSGDDITLTNSIDGTGSVTLSGGDNITAGATAGSFALSYSGSTNLNAGTLKGSSTTTNTLPFNSTVKLASGTTLDLNGQAAAVGGIADGLTAGGVVNASANLTFSGSGTNTFTGALNAGASTIIANGSQSMVQNLNGTVGGFTGVTTVSNGTLNYNTSAATTLGSNTTPVAINIATAANNVGTLGIGANVTYNVSTITVGSNDGTNGIGTLNSSGVIQVFGPGGTATTPSLNIGNNGGTGNVNINGGSMLVAGNVSMSTSGAAASSAISIAAGASVTIVPSANTPGNIIIGSFFNPPATINLNGGNLTFTQADLVTPNASSEIILQNNNSNNFGTYSFNLNAGVMTVGSFALAVTADSNGGNFNLNRIPTVSFNGGTLRAAGSTTTFINPQAAAAVGSTAGIAPATTYQGAAPVNFSILANGGAFDPAGNTVTVSASITHGSGLILDGGFTLNDSSGGGTGILTLSGQGGTVNGGVIVTKGTLNTTADAVAAATASATTNQTTAVTVPNTTALALGQTVSGGGLSAGTVVTAIGNGATAGTLSVTLSNATTDPAGTSSLTFGALSPLGAKLTMNGGTFSSTTGTRDLSAATTLKTTANSTIDLGGAGTLKLADSALTHWANNAVLTINNPTGGHIFVGSGQTMNPNQLKNVTFAGSPQGAIQLATGELVAGAATGTSELLGNVDHNSATDAGDIGALATALSNVNAYTNNLTLDPGWSSKASEALYLADVKNDDQINNLDMQGLIVYLANGGNGSNAPGGGSLSAVPEPSTFVLLAIGGLLFCGRQLRRSRRGDN